MVEGERVALEERLLGDDDLDEELLATTDDLIHAYLSGALSGEDRRRFESYFLDSPDHRERLAFLTDLVSAVERTAERGVEPAATARSAFAPRPWRSWGLAAAAVFVAVGALILLTRPAAEQRIRPATASPPPIESATPSPHARPESPPPQATRPDAVRIVRLPRNPGSAVRVPLSPDTRVVRVEVAVDEGSPSFVVAVRTVDKREVWRAEGLAPATSGKPLVFTIPARIFAASDQYSLRIEGEPLREAVTPVLEYDLRVLHQR